MRIDVIFNVVLWVINSVVWMANGHAGMSVLCLFGVLGSVMLGRLYSDC